jgi:hypothetical protein
MAMLPPLTVQLLHALLTMANVPVGAAGVVQVPGIVATPVDAGLTVLGSVSHEQRVWIV